MSILDAMFGRMFNDSAEITLTQGINFTGGVRGVFNTATKLTDVSVSPNSLTPTMLGAIAASFGVPFVVQKDFAAGTPGTADDVAIITSAPFALQILDRWLDITTAIGASQARFRSDDGGAGNTLSGLFDTGTVCEGRLASSGAVSQAQTVAAAGDVWLRRDNRGIAGTAYLLCVRT